MKHLNSKGFGALESVLVIAIIGIIGGTGYYVYHAKQNSDKNLNASSSTQTASRTKKTQPKTANNKTYTVGAHDSFNYAVAFSAPQDWDASSDPNAIELTSPDYKAASSEPFAITSGAKLVVTTDKAAAVDPSKSTESNLLAEVETGYGTPPITQKYITVAGQKAIYAKADYGGVNNTDEVAFYIGSDNLVTIKLMYNIKGANPYPTLINALTASLKFTKTP